MFGVCVGAGWETAGIFTVLRASGPFNHLPFIRKVVGAFWEGGRKGGRR